MTEPVISLDGVTVFSGDCRSVLKQLPDNSVDSIVTDPPYGLSNTSTDLVSKALVRWISGERDFIPDGKGFMGKDWDAFVPPPAVWDECLRVLKPGGHLLAFFGSRTMDLGQMSIRLAGFEVRDSIAWMYGSGFPKSLDVSKAIDKAAGVERQKWPDLPMETGTEIGGISKNKRCAICMKPFLSGNSCTCDRKSKAITDEAKQWEGWGTALKPAHEPIVVARKPVEGTVAANVLEWGTGGLNIDGSRIGTEPTIRNSHAGTNGDGWGMGKSESVNGSTQGRWPVNVILDDYSTQVLDQQTKKNNSTRQEMTSKPGGVYNLGKGLPSNTGIYGYDDFGGASRFFYTAKASKSDRNEGLEYLETKQTVGGGGLTEAGGAYGSIKAPAKNFHPTVKPTSLMRYLVKLVTPPGGTVLDPFTGSGSTGKAAVLEGFQFIGVELTEDYLPIIEGRLKWALDNRDDGTLF